MLMLKNGIYNVVGAVIRMSLALLTIPMLIRLIGVDEYGLWTLVSATIWFLAVLEGGLPVSTTVLLSREMAKYDIEGISQTLTVTVGAMFVLATLAGLGIWFSASSIVNFFPRLDPAQSVAAVQAMQVGGVVLWARLLQQVLIGVEQAQQRYGMVNLLNTIQAVLTHPGVLVIAWLGGRTVEMMNWYAVTSIVILVAYGFSNWWQLRRLNLSLSWNTAKSREIARYSVLAWLSSLGGLLFGQGDRLVVGWVLGTGPLGVYAAITNITYQINVLSALPVQPILPAVSALFIQREQADLATLRHEVCRASLVNAVVALGTGMILIVPAPLVLQVILPIAATSEQILAFQIAALIYSLYSLNAVGYFVLFGTEAVDVNTVVVILSGVLSLTLIGLLSVSFGLLGAILGNAGYMVTLLLVLYAAQRIQLSLVQLASWIWLPCVWFCTIAAVATIMPYQFLVSSALIVLSGVVFGFWFLRHYQPQRLIRG